MRAVGGEKWCPKCEQTKSVGEYHKNRSASDGLATWCKECVVKHLALVRATQKHKDYMRRYWQIPYNKKMKAKWMREYRARKRAEISTGGVSDGRS